MKDYPIKTVQFDDATLRAISNGRRKDICSFTARIDIYEDDYRPPVLGKMVKGSKKIYASLVLCGDLRFARDAEWSEIDNSKTYEADGKIHGQDIHLSGMAFEDSDPVNNELTFSISDQLLIKSLLLE